MGWTAKINWITRPKEEKGSPVLRPPNVFRETVEPLEDPSTACGLRYDAALPRAIPHVPVNEAPGSRRIRASPVRNAFGGQVMGSTARLRR